MSRAATSGRASATTHWLAIGDSITHGYQGHDPDQELWLYSYVSTPLWTGTRDNAGISGDAAYYMVNRIADLQVRAVNADLITLCIGRNDCDWQLDLDDFEANVNLIVDSLQAVSNAPIILCSIPYCEYVLLGVPVWENTPDYNARIASVASDQGLGAVVDFFGQWGHADFTTYLFDDVHPNHAGQDKLAAVLAVRFPSPTLLTRSTATARAAATGRSTV